MLPEQHNCYLHLHPKTEKEKTRHFTNLPSLFQVTRPASARHCFSSKCSQPRFGPPRDDGVVWTENLPKTRDKNETHEVSSFISVYTNLSRYHENHFKLHKCLFTNLSRYLPTIWIHGWMHWFCRFQVWQTSQFRGRDQSSILHLTQIHGALQKTQTQKGLDTM